MDQSQSSDFQYRVFSVNDAATHLRISRSFLYALIAEKRLQPIKIGKRSMFTGAEVARFLGSAANSSAGGQAR